MATPILTTKLYALPLRPKITPRPRLLAKLNDGLDRKLTLISAQAGFGKSTLVSQWVTTCERPVLIPLGLNNTYASLREADEGDVMSGYFVGYERDIKSTYHGSMIATAENVGIFLRALNDGSLLNEQE